MMCLLKGIFKCFLKLKSNMYNCKKTENISEENKIKKKQKVMKSFLTKSFSQC